MLALLLTNSSNKGYVKNTLRARAHHTNTHTFKIYKMIIAVNKFTVEYFHQLTLFSNIA